MTSKIGLSEDEYFDIVERIQKAMCIEPFRPDTADVVALIGAWQLLNSENERLRAEVERLTFEAMRWAEDNERLRDETGRA